MIIVQLIIQGAFLLTTGIFSIFSAYKDSQNDSDEDDVNLSGKSEDSVDTE